MEGFSMDVSPRPKASPDFLIIYHGTVATLDLLSNAARDRVEDNVQTEPWQWLGRSRVGIDPGHAEELRAALAEAGFSDAEAPLEGSST
jgi:hypothetical protein